MPERAVHAWAAAELGRWLCRDVDCVNELRLCPESRGEPLGSFRMKRMAGKYLGILKHLTREAMWRVTGGTRTVVDRPGKRPLYSSGCKGSCGDGQRG